MPLNLPNKITLARVLLIPVFLIVLLGGFLPHDLARYVAVGIFVLASLTDMLDGYLARKLDMITNFGKFVDPIADKLLTSSALIAMVELGDLPAWMAVIIIGRDFMISGFRLVASEKGSVIAASTWAKIKTAMLMFMIILVLLKMDDVLVIAAVCELLKWLSVIFSAVSAFDYIYKNREILYSKDNK